MDDLWGERKIFVFKIKIFKKIFSYMFVYFKEILDKYLNQLQLSQGQSQGTKQSGDGNTEEELRMEGRGGREEGAVSWFYMAALKSH